MPLFHQSKVQRCLERLLYIWAIRHPASGYVQGMNDLATPFFVVFLSTALLVYDGGSGGGAPASEGAAEGLGLDSVDGELGGRCPLTAAVESLDAQRLPAEVLERVEADTYWCLTKLLDNIQDHYTAGQPGLQRQIYRLEELVRRIDRPLHDHLTSHGIVFTFFSFRWMNNLLMRELPLQAIIRLWDTLLSEDEKGSGFEEFHIFVCAAFLQGFSGQIQLIDKQEDLMCFLQELPTTDWTPSNVETLLSEVREPTHFAGRMISLQQLMKCDAYLHPSCYTSGSSRLTYYLHLIEIRQRTCKASQDLQCHEQTETESRQATPEVASRSKTRTRERARDVARKSRTR